MNDDFYNQIEKVKKQEKQLKIDITRRNDLDAKNQATSLVININLGRCSYSWKF
jgi:hypothetical protein